VLVRSARQPRAVESFPQPELELTRSLFSERDRDDATDVRFAFGDDANDAPDEGGGLARAGGRLDDEGRVEVVGDALARLKVG
jgi:hypothetical protein